LIRKQRPHQVIQPWVPNNKTLAGKLRRLAGALTDTGLWP
jgi:hypothetical protein